MVADDLVGFQRLKPRSVRLTPDDGRRAWGAISRLPSLLWPGPVRARLTIAATIVVGVALVAGAAAVLIVLRATLTEDVRDAASLRATQIAASISDADGAVPVIGNQDGELVQVMDGSGRVVGGSPLLTGAAPMPVPGIGDYVIADGLVDDGHYLLVQARADRPGMAGAPFTVLVARDLDDATDPVTAVTVALVVVVPTDAAHRRRHDLASDGERVGTGGGHPPGGRRDLGQRAAPAGAGSAGHRRDRKAGRHDESNARPAGTLLRPSSGVSSRTPPTNCAPRLPRSGSTRRLRPHIRSPSAARTWRSPCSRRICGYSG